MKYKALSLATVCIFLTCGFAVAQNKLDKEVALHVKNKKIAEVLAAIGKQNDFYFSYSNSWVPVDSLVSISGTKSIRSILDDLFKGNVDYKETTGYIILKKAPYHLVVYPDNNKEPDQSFLITGHVVDETTGKGIAGDRCLKSTSWYPH